MIDPTNFNPDNKMGDDEFAIQMAKIFLGSIIGFLVLFELYKIYKVLWMIYLK